MALAAIGLGLSLLVLPVQAAAPGRVVGWGNDSYGKSTAPDGLRGVVGVAAGSFDSLALKSDGTVVSWGYSGEVTATIPGLNGVKAVAAGSQHCLVLKSNGTMVAWGENDRGQVTGTPSVTSPFTATANPVTFNGQVLSNVTSMAAGFHHTVAVRNDGTVLVWGRNDAGQANVPAGLSNVVAVAAGAFHTVALKNDGTMLGWGGDSHGEVTVPDGLTNVVAVAAGLYHTVALKSDGTVVAWGDSAYAQTPAPVGLSGVMAIAAGPSAHTVALKSNGTVVVWGYNFNGQANVPAGLGAVTAIAAGENNTLAVFQPRPALSLQVAGRNLLLTWPSADAEGFVLDGNANLGLANAWSPVGHSAVSNNSAFSVSLPMTNTSRFFRLRKP